MFDIGNAGGELMIPVDLEQDMFAWAYAAGARVHSDSWGDAVVDNSYTDEALRVDRFMHQHQDFLIVMAAGNDGERGHATVSSPATAKNALTIGASQAPTIGLREGHCGMWQIVSSMKIGEQSF